MSDLELIINHLKNEDFDDDEGICNAVYQFARYLGTDLDYELLLRITFKSWEYFSGRCAYPIPGPTQYFSAYRYYHFMRTKRGCMRTKHGCMWDHTTEYGMLRILLLNHVITELTKELQS